MSENWNRDHSKYDTMTTEELEQILRLDASAPEGEESDTESLLYVMGVLANRRKKNSTGKTALEAWESFQQNYLSEAEESPEHRHKPTSGRTAPPWLGRLIAAAAVVVLVVCIPLTANALGWQEVWEVFARWAKETFSFVSSEDVEVSDPAADDELEYTSLQDMLERNNRPYDMVPTWIPDGYVLERLEKDITPVQEIYRAYFVDGEKELMIRVQTYMPSDVYNVEIEEGGAEVYEAAGIEYYIISNVDQIRFVWIANSYECNVSGDLSIDEVKKMIDSIGKG